MSSISDIHIHACMKHLLPDWQGDCDIECVLDAYSSVAYMLLSDRKLQRIEVLLSEVCKNESWKYDFKGEC